MTETTHINDIGTSLQITVTEGGAVVDISAATSLQITTKSPDGTETTYTASLVNDGTDGIMAYATQAGDIDQAGTWSYWGTVTFSATSKFTTIDPQTFTAID